MRQVDQLRQFLTGHLPLLIVDLAFVGLFLAVLLVITPALGIVTAAAMPVFALLSTVAQRYQQAHQQASSRAAAAKASALGEAVSQVLTVKLLALEADMKRRFERHLFRSAWTGLQSGRIAHVAASLGQALQHLTALVLVYLGARMIVAGEMNVGALVAASILSARALTRCGRSRWPGASSSRHASWWRRLDELMAERGEASGRLAGAEMAVQGRLRVEQVSFRYPGAKEPALDGVTLEVSPGTMLGRRRAARLGQEHAGPAAAGHRGAGIGRVMLDDLDLHALSPVSYRAQIGVVPQEVQLFAGTIAENIALGAPDRAYARIVAAARFVGADEFIRLQPKGYETMLGERGARALAGPASADRPCPGDRAQSPHARARRGDQRARLRGRGVAAHQPPPGRQRPYGDRRHPPAGGAAGVRSRRPAAARQGGPCRVTRGGAGPDATAGTVSSAGCGLRARPMLSPATWTARPSSRANGCRAGRLRWRVP